MRVLLVYPPYRNLVGPAEGIMEPLGLTYVAAFLKKNGIEVDILDCTPLGLNIDQAVGVLRKKRFDLLGIHSNVPLIGNAAVLAKKVKQLRPDLQIVLGGHQATDLPRQTLEKFDCFDFAVVGEGEETFLELIKELKKKRSDLKKIKGIGYRNKKTGRVIINQPRELIGDLDSLPFPARELIDLTKYRPPIKAYYDSPMATMYTSRGCPFRCTFCAYAKGAWRYRSPENIVSEIEHLVKKYKIRGIQFYDDTLTTKKDRLIKICDLILKKRLQISWGCYSRVDIVDEEMLQKMRQAGCRMISYGVESGSQRMLNIMKKGITLDQARSAVALTKKAGILCSASFIFGIPGETPKSIRKTINFAKEIDPHFAHFNMITPWPGTELYRSLVDDGVISPNDWENYYKKKGMHSPTIPVKGLSQKELKGLSRRAYQEFYLRPQKILDLLSSPNRNKLFFRYLKSFWYLLNLKG